MTGQTNEAQWYIARDGKQHGPLTDVEMQTFIGHNYLRPTDLLWRPGMDDWLPAPQVFPAVFQAQGATQVPGATQPTAMPGLSGGHHDLGASDPAYAGGSQIGQADQGLVAPQATGDVAAEGFEDAPPRSSFMRRAMVAVLAICVIGGGAYAVANYSGSLMRLVSTPKKAAPAAGEAAKADASDPAAGGTQTAALTPDPTTSIPTSPDPALIEGSQLDQRLQKIPAWSLLKRDFPDWYITNVAAADKLTAESKPGTEVASHLIQSLVNLRRQNADKALAASPEKLKRLATAFLDNLRALQGQSVGACYGYISKGEMSGAVIEQMQTPENATTFNEHVLAVFEAVAEGGSSPVTHQPAVKTDYDLLIAELAKLGWKEEDLQVFSNPRLLAKREPAQVCKMVQEWFVAHLSVPDASAQERLLFETLKPVLSG